MPRLRPYQEVCCEEIARCLKTNTRVLAEMATGTGKTMTMASFIKNTQGRHLIICTGDDLISQLVNSVSRITGEFVGVEKAGQTAHDSLSRIVVASVPSLRTDKRLARYVSNHFDYCLIDEAHMSAADGYSVILSHFSAKMVLFTATAYRADKKALPYDAVAFRYPYRDAVKDGWLVPVVFDRVPLKIDARAVSTKKGDYDLNELNHAIEPYLESAAREVAARPNGKHLVFLPLVDTSKKMTDILNGMGMRACHVDGTMGDRSRIIEAFVSGDYNVLTNAQVFSVGTDIPCADHLMNLRLTKSLTRYVQTCGRVLRPLTEITTTLNEAGSVQERRQIIAQSSKPHATIIDPLWLTKKHDLCTPPDLVTQDKEEARLIKKEYATTGRVNLAESVERVAGIRSKVADEIERHSTKQREIDSIGLRQWGIDITEYRPHHDWEFLEPTDKQLEWLKKQGIRVGGMNRGMAKRVMDQIIDSDKATPAQINLLKRFGVDGRKMGKNTATKIIEERLSKYKKKA